jgi:spermidine synthase
MSRWVEETFHPHWRVRFEADEILHEVKTEHQHLVIFKNRTWGTVLMLDGVCQLTTSDELIYHEMMAHVPLMALDKPRRVLVVGGGDGGVLREVLKHPTIEKAMLCEI